MEMVLAAFVPAAFLVAALVPARRPSMIAKVVWALLAVLVSLPVGLLCLFAPISIMMPPNYDPNHGIGVIALPLVVSWMLILLLWLGGVIALGISRYFAASPAISRRTSN